MTEYQPTTTDPGSAETEERDEVRQAFAVLANAVAELIRQGERPPTASEVRLAMKRLTYGGFNPKELGFSRFRDFLTDAETRGLVEVDASRQGDVAVHLGSITTRDLGTHRVIRRDLWRAFVDWTAALSRFYDLKYQRTVIFPTEPAPLEPAKYREIRARVESSPEEFVRIEPIPVQRQILWMREFTEESADPQIRAVLIAALNSEKPVKAFNGVLRTVPGQAVRWKNAFQARAREHIETWQRDADEGGRIEIYRESEAQSLDSEKSAKPDSHELPAAHRSGTTSFTIQLGGIPFANPGWASLVPSHSPDSAVVALRIKLHAAIDRMPLDELRALRLPVGYLFEE